MNPCYANYAREQNKQKVQQRKKVTQLLNADKRSLSVLKLKVFLDTHCLKLNSYPKTIFWNVEL